MDPEIKVIEDLSLNAWPSHQMQVYDGWIVRFSYYYTHRTNCVEQIGPSQLPYDEKLAYCEEIYRRWQTPCLFKISPISDPALTELLVKNGYTTAHPTDVMTLDLDSFDAAANAPSHTFTISNQVSYTWLQGLFDLKKTTNIIHRRIVPSMYAAIPKDVIALLYMEGDRVAATGLGILDRDYIGIYAIHVDEAFRRQHIARDIVTTLLIEGRRCGAGKAYLQVVSDNEPAKALYRSIGFEKRYDYHFLLRDVE